MGRVLIGAASIPPSLQNIRNFSFLCLRLSKWKVSEPTVYVPCVNRARVITHLDKVPVLMPKRGVVVDVPVYRLF